MVNLQSLQTRPKASALKAIEHLRPADVFTPTQLRSPILLDEARDQLVSRWQAEAERFVGCEVERAIVAVVEKLHKEARGKVKPIVIEKRDGSFKEALGDLFTQVPVDAATVEEVVARRREYATEAMLFVARFYNLMSEGRNVEAVALANAYLVRLLEALKAASDSLQELKEDTLRSLSSPAALTFVTQGNRELESDARDILQRVKAIVREMFDGSDLRKKSAIVQTLTAFIAFANDLEVRKGGVSLRGVSYLKQALDANTVLERQYALGFINPKSRMLDERLATGKAIRTLYDKLDGRSRSGLNHFLQLYTGDKLFDLAQLKQTSAVIAQAVGGVRGFALLGVLLELGFFKQLKTDIGDVCKKLTLEELTLMTRAELEVAIRRIRTTPYAGDAFIYARDGARLTTEL